MTITTPLLPMLRSMSAATIHFKWSRQRGKDAAGKTAMLDRVVWSLVATNNETLVTSNQGAKDTRDAVRQVDAVLRALTGSKAASLREAVAAGHLKRVGPGKKPT